ncbi:MULTISPECIES: hypothetical protein [unclassified Streptomyces]|uniref:hypothetical protein n=1 Tax=unclassified Streptomyces TaxID=2593676 RepID=UPI002E2B9D7D|nr:hypothetical protein [Streptomyces sp. NBC_00273]
MRAVRAGERERFRRRRLAAGARMFPGPCVLGVLDVFGGVVMVTYGLREPAERAETCC